MISSLLIANRGEIARQIARTASSMGIKTVAVYAEGDAGEPFVKGADRAVALAGRTAAETYLHIDALIAAAGESGADAVHPGYGFLSERAGFARAVLGAGLVWVGPPPEVIEAMGDKLAAKRLMSAAGVPVLPTWEPGDAGVVLPVMVKASAGGGGKGMRVVQSAGELPHAVAAAQREAQAAFGDPTVFLERYVTGARHVEVQVLADGFGNVVHCYERECSIQRRHQKVIEESPSPALDDDLRDRMTSAAVAAAKAVGYRNAGTVEFVLEPSGDFWFLEVNTRLQVEHPVTEAVTGLDLVHEQLLVAQGLPLSVTQGEIGVAGRAIEARLYAEDPAAGFLPQTGTLVDWAPAVDPVARWDSGVEPGSVVGVEFDPMLAKVVAHAPTRSEAALRLALALERSRIRGVTTNRDFLVAVLRHPQFLAGDTATDFIERSGVALSLPPAPGEVRVAAIAAALHAQAGCRAAAPVLRSIPGGWRNSVMPAESRAFDHAGETVEVRYRARRDGAFDVDGEVVRLHGVEGGWVDFEVAGRRRHRLHVMREGTTVWAHGPDGDVRLESRPLFSEAGSEVAVPGGLRAPMPGKVISVDVRPGEQVAEGQLLLIVEAMKMEHRVEAPHAGVVTEVRAHAGDQVAGGDLLVVLET
ncbi:MAG: biotin carboxylase N-terminal domain-containing protein [Acidimicrobiales bacterium]